MGKTRKSRKKEALRKQREKEEIGWYLGCECGDDRACSTCQKCPNCSKNNHASCRDMTWYYCRICFLRDVDLCEYCSACDIHHKDSKCLE